MNAEEFYLGYKEELNLPDGWYENEIQTLMQWYADHIFEQCDFLNDVNFRDFTSHLRVAEHQGFKGYGETKMKALDSLLNEILKKATE